MLGRSIHTEVRCPKDHGKLSPFWLERHPSQRCLAPALLPPHPSRFLITQISHLKSLLAQIAAQTYTTGSTRNSKREQKGPTLAQQLLVVVYHLIEGLG